MNVTKFLVLTNSLVDNFFLNKLKEVKAKFVIIYLNKLEIKKFLQLKLIRIFAAKFHLHDACYQERLRD